MSNAAAPRPVFYDGSPMPKVDAVTDPRDQTIRELVAALQEIADGCVAYQPGHVNYQDNRTKPQIREIAEAALAKVQA